MLLSKPTSQVSRGVLQGSNHNGPKWLVRTTPPYWGNMIRTGGPNWNTNHWIMLILIYMTTISDNQSYWLIMVYDTWIGINGWTDIIQRILKLSSRTQQYERCLVSRLQALMHGFMYRQVSNIRPTKSQHFFFFFYIKLYSKIHSRSYTQQGYSKLINNIYEAYYKRLTH